MLATAISRQIEFELDRAAARAQMFGTENMSNRDQRFVAEHRGGSLKRGDHALMAAWAADCAEHVLHLFESLNADGRPRNAITIARAWAKSEVSVGDARGAAFAAHDSARSVTDKSAVAAGRACGHAVATAHMADHCLSAAYYALRAIIASGACVDAEIGWQLGKLPEKIRSLVESGLERKYPMHYQTIPSQHQH